MILDLCERFHCLPSALYDEPAELLGLIELDALARPRRPPDEQ